MSKKRKIKSPSRLTLFLVFIVGLILISAGLFFYQRRNCLSIDFLMCASSESYQSETASLSFRYPNFFPFDKPNEEWELKQAANSGRVELMDFSNEFYFNAGGDRLGWIEVGSSDFSNIDEYEKELLKPRTIYAKGVEVPVPPPHVKRVTIGNNIEALSINPDATLALLARNKETYVFFKNGLMYTISFNYDPYHHKLPEERYLKGFDLIISTLEI